MRRNHFSKFEHAFILHACSNFSRGLEKELMDIGGGRADQANGMDSSQHVAKGSFTTTNIPAGNI
ncbi:hypothetical protein C9418_19880 [Rhizobium sp. SEMIA 4032]|nr:hypothetical protein C9418_19880 [Rhizobium sp. SEMIA 4032]